MLMYAFIAPAVCINIIIYCQLFFLMNKRVYNNIQVMIFALFVAIKFAVYADNNVRPRSITKS